MKSLLTRIINYRTALKTVILLTTLFILSCSNDSTFDDAHLPPTAEEKDRPPIADAGQDRIITLPSEVVALDGSRSSDLIGINSYKWKKIEGPDDCHIADPEASRTYVAGLIEGVYQFELTVVNTKGLLGTDTMQVIVLAAESTQTACDYINRIEINAHLIEIGTLSEARGGLALASARNKIFFAGGDAIDSYGNYPATDAVDIYNVDDLSWTTANLSKARTHITTISNKNTVFFAGGEPENDWANGPLPVDDVDIYDVETDIWTTAHLCSPGIGMTATAVGNKVLFAGGYDENEKRPVSVDIFDLSSGVWTVATLSEAKFSGHAAVTLGDKAYIAGGRTQGSVYQYFSDKIDIYDSTTDSWSVETMYEAKYGFAGITVNEDIYWAGGSTGADLNTYASSRVEIWNPGTDTTTLDCLQAGFGYPTAVQIGNKIVLFRYSNEMSSIIFDIYDTLSNTWYYGALSTGVFYSGIIAVNNVIYVAGGYENNPSNKVYILEFEGL